MHRKHSSAANFLVDPPSSSQRIPECHPVDAPPALDPLALHKCVFVNDVERLKRLLESKEYNVDLQDQYGNTALHIAVTLGGEVAESCVPLLLQHGSRASIMNNEGMSVQRSACNR